MYPDIAIFSLKPILSKEERRGWGGSTNIEMVYFTNQEAFNLISKRYNFYLQFETSIIILRHRCKENYERHATL